MFGLPRRYAMLPLLIGAAWMGTFTQVALGPLHFNGVRVLVAAGLLRAVTKGERISGGCNRLDWAMIIWGSWAVCSSVFHSSNTLVFRLGIVYDCAGVYFLCRILVQDYGDLVRVFKIICIVLAPVGAAMMIERSTGKNSFELLGGAPGEAVLRHGHYRARGPFIHAILAGTSGAACLPMAVFLWWWDRKLALLGMVATAAIVVASGSSGPAMTALTVVFALSIWKVRRRLRLFCWLAVLLVIGLDIAMNDPVYYLMARIDITGGSTGWHRAALIDSAIKYFHEWWLGGTDVTRHWMPTGIYANETETDITNYFLQMGVWGGVPLLLLFLWVLYQAFAALGRALRVNEHVPFEQRFLFWTLGAILFGHTTTFMSISYYDQTVVFLYLVLAGIGSLCLKSVTAVPVATELGEGFDGMAQSPIIHG
jgi:hypothetical protein